MMGNTQSNDSDFVAFLCRRKRCLRFLWRYLIKLAADIENPQRRSGLTRLAPLVVDFVREMQVFHQVGVLELSDANQAILASAKQMLELVIALVRPFKWVDDTTLNRFKVPLVHMSYAAAAEVAELLSSIDKHTALNSPNSVEGCNFTSAGMSELPRSIDDKPGAVTPCTCDICRCWDSLQLPLDF